jgi:hypothetical protein
MSQTLTQPTLVAPAAEPASLTDHPCASCLHCGHPVAQRFCGNCGQDAHHTHRFTLRFLLLHDLPHSVWHIDKGVLYTLKQMLLRPGAAIREYLAGRRAQHFRPITYMLLLGGLTALLLSALQLHPDPKALDSDQPRALALALERYTQLVYKYPNVHYVALAPLNALVAWWLLRPARLNYAEMLLAQAFVSGTLAVLVTAAMAPLAVVFRQPQYYFLISLFGLLPTITYSTWVNWQLLAETQLSAVSKGLRALFTTLMQLVLLTLAGIGLLVYILLSLLRQDPELMKEFKAKEQHARSAKVQPALQR